MEAHWISAAATLITESEPTRLGALGRELLYRKHALEAAAFSVQYSTQPRHPSQTPKPDFNQARQLQIWITGPVSAGKYCLHYLDYLRMIWSMYWYPWTLRSRTNVSVTTTGISLVSIELDEWGVREVYGGRSWTGRGEVFLKGARSYLVRGLRLWLGLGRVRITSLLRCSEDDDHHHHMSDIVVNYGRWACFISSSIGLKWRDASQESPLSNFDDRF